MLAGCVVVSVLLPPIVSATGGAHAPALSVEAIGNNGGSTPFAGDGPLLTTISPNGDGLRDQAAIHLTLGKPATATIEICRTWRHPAVVYSRTARLHAGSNSIRWPATARVSAGTYVVHLTLVKTGIRPGSDARRTCATRSSATPVVRVLGIGAAFARESSAPNRVALLAISTDVRSLSLAFFRSDPGRARFSRAGTLDGNAVTRPVTVDWHGHANHPARIPVWIGDWPTGLYYMRLAAPDGRVGYAPLIVRPPRLGQHRVAVVLPTNTWQAYNFWDQDGDGLGDTWYAGSTVTVRLDRPYLARGVPPHFRTYDLPFLHWLAWRKRPVDYLADSDLERVSTGAELARAYDLVIFPGHHEYVTTREYDVMVGYRNLGGNLMFLSANNFFWRITRHGEVLRRVAQWRQLGRPEAGLIGVQYRASDRGQRKGSFVVRSTKAAPWFFHGTGLVVGSHFTGVGSAAGPFGIEIDATAPSSPRGTRILAAIPNLFGRGITAQMTYYETPSGAKVFAAGAFTLAGAANSEPVAALLDNLWAHLERP